MSVLVDVHKRGVQQRKISEYTTQVASFWNKLQKKEDFGEEATYIIAQSHEMSAIFADALHPTLTLASRLASNGLYGIDAYINEIGRDEIETHQRLNNEKRNLYKHLWNPFTLFYRGIGFVLRYVFGYLIEMFDSDFDFEGRVWKIINLVLSLVAGIITIITFFGYDWSKIISLI